MADLTIFPTAFIDRRAVLFLWRDHLIEAMIGIPDPADPYRHVSFSALATNPERALADLRTKVEVWEDSLLAKPG